MRTALLAAAGALGLLLLAGAVVLALRRERAPDNTAAERVAVRPPSPRPAAPATKAAHLPRPDEHRPGRGKEMTPPPVTRDQPADKAVIKRRFEVGEDDLLAEAFAAPEVALDRTDAQAESAAAVRLAKRVQATVLADSDPTLALLDRRPDLAGLPLRRGNACRLTPSEAGDLDERAADLRGGTRDADALRQTLAGDGAKPGKWLQAKAVPALMQVVMAEAAPVREVLAEQLARIDGKAATAALAQLALFDLSPRVRERAIGGLAARPAKDYRGALLKGLEHPWPPVADHAAEALVALKRTEAVPDLKELLKWPDPGAPYRKAGARGSFVKDLVRVNHLRNCVLCHAPSLSRSDKVRGRVPVVGEELPPSSSRAYYSKDTGTFVRADITYLKQDFSVALPVDNPGQWPAVQRFDFFVRERQATDRDIRESASRATAGPSEQHKAIHFALRELTGRVPRR
jgi:hypothetical protein